MLSYVNGGYIKPVYVKGVQRGLDDFEAGRFRSFAEFAEE